GTTSMLSIPCASQPRPCRQWARYGYFDPMSRVLAGVPLRQSRNSAVARARLTSLSASLIKCPVKPPWASFSWGASYVFGGIGAWNQQSQEGHVQYGEAAYRVGAGTPQIGQLG